MVLYRRHLVPGATYFFTVALADRRSDTLTAHITHLRAAFRRARNETPFGIDAIVILPEHLHAILTMPPDDADFPRMWRRIKTLFTQNLLQSGAHLPSRDTTGRILWQRRFWEHTIRDEADQARCIDYIHYNPVKHGLVTNPADWPYSSFHRFIRHGLSPHDWKNAAIDSDDFGEPIM